MTVGVEIEHVQKRFADKLVLDDVSIIAPEGRTTAIVGASGCGITTLLRLVNGVLQPDAGTVRVFGECVPQENVELFCRRIGYAVQGAALFPHMTGRQNVTLIAKLQGWSEQDIESRFISLLREMDLLLDVADRLPRALSGGQQQRLGLCRALMLKPKLLLLDEPFSAVDPITRVEIYDRFLEVQSLEGVTSLLVTHDLREARRLAQYLVILRGGSVAQQGKTAEVLDEPANDYVRSLVASQLQ